MKYLLKRTLRIIAGTLTQFLAIILIIAIGSGIFTGLIGTIQILDSWIDEYYTTNNLADAWVYIEGASTTDIQTFNLENSELEIEGRYTYKRDAVLNGKSVYYIFLSETNINQYQLSSGSKEIKDYEVIVDESFAIENQLTIGSKFKLVLNEVFEYEVIGLFQSPEFSYKSKDNSDGASNKAGVGVIYTTAENIVSMLKQDEAYLDAKDEVDEKLSDAQAEIDDAYRTLLKEKKNFDQEKIDVYAEIDQNKIDLISKRDELYVKNDELIQARRSIEFGLSQLNLGINQAETSFNESQALLDTAFASLNNNPGLPTQAEWDINYAQLNAQQAQLTTQRDSTLNPLYAQRQSLFNQQTQVESGLNSVSDGLTQIEDGLVKIDDAYLTADKEFIKAQKLINDAFKDYEEGLIEFKEEKADAYLKLDESVLNYYEILVTGDDTSKFEESIKADDRYIYWVNRDIYPGNSMLENILSPIKVMTLIFPVLFFLVAAILILITMAKMVEHDRTQIAIMKALGLSTRTITLSYLMYGWLAAISGSLIFGYFGNWLIPNVLLNIFTIRFSIPEVNIVYYHELSFIAIILSLFFASIAILLALRSVLKETPSQGLRPKPPKNARRSILEKVSWLWTRLSYANKLMIRNLSVGRIKILLSSIGVVGALALLVIGLSLRSSANLTVQNTVGSFNFDASIQISEDVPIETSIDLPVSVETVEPYLQVSAEYNDQVIQLHGLIDHQVLLSIRDRNNEIIDIDSSSVIIPQSFAILNNLEVNDLLEFIYDDKEYALKITDINNQFLGRTMYVSMNQLDKLGVNLETNRFYLKTKYEFSEAIKEVLINDDLVESVDTKSIITEKSNEILSMLNQVILIILMASFALTSTVIYNLASINIVEREREIATLRVLGYTHREVKRLINSENYVLLTLGSILGLPVGTFLSKWISHMVSTKEFYMPDIVEVDILVFSVVIAFIITFITNLILEVKIRRIQLVESLKAVE